MAGVFGSKGIGRILLTRVVAGVTGCGVTDSGVTDSGVADSRVADSGVSDSEVTDSGVTDSRVTDSRVTGSGFTGARLTGTTGATGFGPPLPTGMGSTDPAETPIPYPGEPGPISRRTSSNPGSNMLLCYFLSFCNLIEL